MKYFKSFFKFYIVVKKILIYFQKRLHGSLGELTVRGEIAHLHILKKKCSKGLKINCAPKRKLHQLKKKELKINYLNLGKMKLLKMF